MAIDMEQIPPSDPDEIQQFWELARERAGLGRLMAVTGIDSSASVPAQSWAFGDSPRLADELLDLVLAGAKTATSAALWEFTEAEEPVPARGDLSIVLDGRGHPRALIRTTSVVTTTFDEVDAEHAFREGEGDRSLEAWRTEHELYFRRQMQGRAAGFSPDLRVVLERFEVLFPTRIGRGPVR